MSAHVPMYLLLELVNGELGPERNILPFVFDHIEACSECAASLQVLVTLKANRAEALEAVRAAKAPTRPTIGWFQGILIGSTIAIAGSLFTWWLFSLVRA